jgi:DNA-binding response OmpR family regulator
MEDVRNRPRLGVDDHLTKTVMPDVLVAAVRGNIKRFRRLVDSPSSKSSYCPEELPGKSS